MSKLTIGVVGLGMGSLHLEGAISHGADVIAICDINEEQLKTVGEKNNIPEEKRYTDWKKLLDIKEMEAVIIATPDQQHKELVLAFLEAGKHIMCEKPLALTREDLVEIIEAAKKYDTKFMVGQICRFTPSFVKAKEIVDAGTIGELYYVESEYAHDYEKRFIENGDTYWRNDPLRHGVVGGGCHAVDLLRWFVGDPEEVFAYGSHKMLPYVTYDDTTISVLKFPNGVCGKIFVSTGCKRPYTMRTLLYGTKGTIICDNTSETMELYVVGEDGVEFNEEPQIINIEVNNHNADEEFAVFMDAVTTDSTDYPDAVQGAKTVEVCLAIVESSVKGTPIAPNYNF